MYKNLASQKLIVFAFDATTNLPKTGDAANITAYVSKDYGSVTVLGDTSATEMDSTNAKGFYLFDLTQAETNADTLLFSAKSSTANIVVTGSPATTFTLPSGMATTGVFPSVAAGGSGGILISGSNTGTTTLGALTVTGSTTMSDGLLVSRSTSNVSAITATGNGTGHGIAATSGGGATGDGINATSVASVGNGAHFTGAGSSHGFFVTGGLTGRGFNIVGGATSGIGMSITTASGDGLSIIAATGHGITSSGGGTTKHGMNLVGGGTTANGLRITGGATSGDGIKVTTTSGHGMNLAPVGASVHGIFSTGGNSGTSDGINSVAGTGGVDIRGNITGNLVGTVSTLTTYTGDTPQTGDSYARIGAAGASLTGIYTTAMTESYAAAGGTFSIAQALYEIAANIEELAISGTTGTFYKRDHVTSAGTFSLDSSSSPTTRQRAT